MKTTSTDDKTNLLGLVSDGVRKQADSVVPESCPVFNPSKLPSNIYMSFYLSTQNVNLKHYQSCLSPQKNKILKHTSNKF